MSEISGKFCMVLAYSYSPNEDTMMIGLYIDEDVPKDLEGA